MRSEVPRQSSEGPSFVERRRRRAGELAGKRAAEVMDDALLDLPTVFFAPSLSSPLPLAPAFLPYPEVRLQSSATSSSSVCPYDALETRRRSLETAMDGVEAGPASLRPRQSGGVDDDDGGASRCASGVSMEFFEVGLEVLPV